MRWIPRVASITAGALLACPYLLSPDQTRAADPRRFILEGNAHYYAGRPERAIASYQAALRREPSAADAWLNGAVVWGELGKPGMAANWYRRAAGLKPGSADARTALGEALLRAGDADEARRYLDSALSLDPRSAHAWTALGRLELSQGSARAAAGALQRAVELRPELAVAQFYLGRARLAQGDERGALKAFGTAAADPYFTHAGSLADGLRKRLKAPPPPVSKSASGARPPAFLPPPAGRVPRLRVGIRTGGLGEPISWSGLTFFCNAPFEITTAGGRRIVARGRAGGRWRIQSSADGSLLLRPSGGRKATRVRGPLLIRPSKGGWTFLRDTAFGRVPRLKGTARTLRGTVEVSRGPRGRGLRIVNEVDLETYTHGVVAAEMPAKSPVEALKAQAILARTHALYILKGRSRHRRGGYDLCDGQHCQVYYGVGGEAARARAVVEATRGRVVTLDGRVTQVLYASNCGGHTQSADDVHGWGEWPHLSGSPDAPPEAELPSSPWELRRWLRERPLAYCAPSGHVHAAHFRWSRAVPARELHRRLERALKVGRVSAILPLKRAPSGHLNSILVRGARGDRVVSSEMAIRGLFGIGSQRSALFVMDEQPGPDGRPAEYLFYGGGWGHGVGMCQSGAMGRAAAGEPYDRIVKAYYKGVEIGRLRY